MIFVTLHFFSVWKCDQSFPDHTVHMLVKRVTLFPMKEHQQFYAPVPSLIINHRSVLNKSNLIS